MANKELLQTSNAMDAEIETLIVKVFKMYRNKGRQDADCSLDRSEEIRKELTDRINIPGAEAFTGLLITLIMREYSAGRNQKE